MERIDITGRRFALENRLDHMVDIHVDDHAAGSGDGEENISLGESKLACTHEELTDLQMKWYFVVVSTTRVDVV